MHINKTIEKSAQAWFFRFLIGPAMILDAIIFILTLGVVSFGLQLKAARQLALARFKTINTSYHPSSTE